MPSMKLRGRELQRSCKRQITPWRCGNSNAKEEEEDSGRLGEAVPTNTLEGGNPETNQVGEAWG